MIATQSLGQRQEYNRGHIATNITIRMHEMCIENMTLRIRCALDVGRGVKEREYIASDPDSTETTCAHSNKSSGQVCSE